MQKAKRAENGARRAAQREFAFFPPVIHPPVARSGVEPERSGTIGSKEFPLRLGFFEASRQRSTLPPGTCCRRLR